jgi:hypothetical protein
LDIDGKRLVVTRSPNPAEIKWEHIGVPWLHRIVRSVGTTLVLLAIIVACYVSVFEVQQNANSRAFAYNRPACETFAVLTTVTDPALMVAADGNTITYQKVLWDQNSGAYNKTLSYGGNGYLRCFCEELSSQKGPESALKFTFFNIVSNKSETWCKTLQEDVAAASYQFYFIALVICAFNSLMMSIAPTLVDFESWESTTHESMSLLLKSCISQYLNTGLLILVIYGDVNALSGSTAASRLGGFGGDLSDFNYDWYKSVGASLLFLMLVFPVANQIVSAAPSAVQLIKRIWDMRTGRFLPPWFSMSITHVNLQTELDALYVGYEFPVEIQYGSALAFISVCLTYGSYSRNANPSIHITVLYFSL